MRAEGGCKSNKNDNRVEIKVEESVITLHLDAIRFAGFDYI